MTNIPPSPAPPDENLTLPKIKILSCNFFSVTEPWNYSVMSSPFWYLWWNEEPGCEVLFGDLKIELTPERVLLIPPYTIFSTRKRFSAPFHQLYIHFSAPDLQVRREPILLSSEIEPESFLEKMRRIQGSAAAFNWYSILFGCLARIPRPAFLRRGETAIDPRIQRVLEVINMGGHFQFPNRYLAKQANMSENNMHRLFKREIGHSPHQYLLQRRIAAAREMLLDSNLPISEIARLCGFSDRYHFSRSFKAMLGVPPASCRKLNPQKPRR